MRKPLETPFEARVFPESVIYCLPRPGTKFVSLSRNRDDEPDYPIPLIDRTMQGKNILTLYFFIREQIKMQRGSSLFAAKKRGKDILMEARI